MSVITQQLSPIINLLPFLPKVDLLESLFQLALPILNNFLGTALSGLFGKRDLEKNILDEALNAIQPILGSVVNQLIGTLLGSLLGKRDLNKNIFDDAWNTIQPIINQVIVPALPSILTSVLTGLLGKRDVEKINLQDIFSFVQSSQIQQLYQQYAPLAQQLFQQYVPMIQVSCPHFLCFCV